MSNILATYTGLDQNSLSIILSYVADDNLTKMGDDFIQRIFYKDLAHSIVHNADRIIDSLDTTQGFWLLPENSISNESFNFPPLYKKQKKLFVTQLFQRIHIIAQKAGIILNESDLDLESILQKTKRAISLNNKMRLTAEVVGLLGGILTVCCAVSMLGIDTYSEEDIMALRHSYPDIDGHGIAAHLLFKRECGNTLMPLCQLGFGLSVITASFLSTYAVSCAPIVRCATRVFDRFFRLKS